MKMKKCTVPRLRVVLLAVMITAAAFSAGCGGSGGEEAAVPDHIDIDLTEMSSTMIYSEVFNMVNTPEDYMDKAVKMGGQFAVYEDEQSGKTYYACIIQDATQCCSQGIEFEPADEDMKYPDDFPEVGDEIEVKGIFGTYNEGDQRYCVLRQADIKSVQEEE